MNETKLLVTKKINKILNYYIEKKGFDLRIVIKNLFPLQYSKYTDTLLNEIAIKEIRDYNPYIYLNIEAFQDGKIIEFYVYIDHINSYLIIENPKDIFYDLYTIKYDLPIIFERIYENKETGIKIVKRFSRFGRPIVKRMINDKEYNIFTFYFNFNDFKAKIKLHIKSEKEFKETLFIKTLLELKQIPKDIKELEDLLYSFKEFGLIDIETIIMVEEINTKEDNDFDNKSEDKVEKTKVRKYIKNNRRNYG